MLQKWMNLEDTTTLSELCQLRIILYYSAYEVLRVAKFIGTRVEWWYMWQNAVENC